MIAASKHWWWWIATWFGCGKSPIVSGTVGSAAALPFAYLIHHQLGPFGLFIAAWIIFFLGWLASKHFLEKTGCEHDPKDIVVDEVAGQWLLLSALPLTWQGYLVGFILFRAFDIIKPWPVRWLDKNVEGAVGVMLDDMAAAVYPILLFLLSLIISNALGETETIHTAMGWLYGDLVQ
ncbi:MAG: phosphatidylglycerophosphatase A [Rickettsiales bacterium]|jgi:phosphatidylglycerophosphatase A|nr:phosphatidylglycerophosphatase A [Rickettsiales bacterium]